MIGISYYSSLNDISGVTSWLVRLVEALRARGDRVAVNLHHFGREPHNSSISKDLAGLGVELESRVMPEFTEMAVRDTLEFINRVRPDVFLPQALPGLHFAAKTASEQGLPYVFTIHSDDPVYWAIAEKIGPPPEIGAWVVVSEEIAREVRRRFPMVEPRLIPYGVVLPEKVCCWSDGKFRVVYSGRLIEEQKRVSLVIETFVQACRLSDQIETVVIGGGPEFEKMAGRIKDEKLGDRIRFTGRLTARGVAEELSKAQSILLMSDYEGLPVAMLEAMARGVVPVARSIKSGIPELVVPGQTGILVTDQPQQAAEALVNLSKNEQEWSKLSSGARQLVREFYSESVCMARWFELLDELRCRSKLDFPLKIPQRIKLPPLDARLQAYDRRSPGTLRQVWNLVRRISARLGD